MLKLSSIKFFYHMHSRSAAHISEMHGQGIRTIKVRSLSLSHHITSTIYLLPYCYFAHKVLALLTIHLSLPLDALRKTALGSAKMLKMRKVERLCVFLQGPEIRTGFLKDGKPIQLKEGNEITISTDYTIKGDEGTISMSYKKLPVDLKPGNVILCADGTITLTVLSCDPAAGTVRCRCENTAMLGERKNVNLPGVVVDLPTLTEKDKEDILEWGVPNNIDMIALSFVRKGSDLVNVRKVLGPHAKTIQLMSKVCKPLAIIDLNWDFILKIIWSILNISFWY